MSSIRSALYFFGAVAGAVLVLFILLMLRTCFYSPEQKAKMDEKFAARESIDRCRHSQDDELKELSTRRFIRAACDRMEQEFRREYGVEP